MRPRRWDVISGNRADFGVKRICRVPGASRAGYYQHLATGQARAERRAECRAECRAERWAEEKRTVSEIPAIHARRDVALPRHGHRHLLEDGGGLVDRRSLAACLDHPGRLGPTEPTVAVLVIDRDLPPPADALADGMLPGRPHSCTSSADSPDKRGGDGVGSPALPWSGSNPHGALHRPTTNTSSSTPVLRRVRQHCGSALGQFRARADFVDSGTMDMGRPARSACQVLRQTLLGDRTASGSRQTEAAHPAVRSLSAAGPGWPARLGTGSSGVEA